MTATMKVLRRKMPKVHRRLDGETWELLPGRTGSGHMWMRHIPSGRRVTAPFSASDRRAELNLLKRMDRYERGMFE